MRLDEAVAALLSAHLGGLHPWLQLQLALVAAGTLTLLLCLFLQPQTALLLERCCQWKGSRIWLLQEERAQARSRRRQLPAMPCARWEESQTGDIHPMDDLPRFETALGSLEASQGVQGGAVGSLASWARVSTS